MAADATAPASAAGNNDNTLMIVLSWIFAPIVGLFFMNHQDSFLQYHAKQSVYFGAADVVINILFFVLNSVLTVTIVLAPIACVTGLIQLVWWIVALVVRVYGAVQGAQGRRWEVPVIGKYAK